MRLFTRCAVFLIALPVFAHHGKDFLMIDSPELPHKATVYFVTSERFVFSDSTVAFRDEPSMLAGLTDRIAAEVHAHIAKEPHEGAAIEALSPVVHIHLFDSGAVHAGMSAEYEIGFHGEENSATVRFIAARSTGEGAIIGNLGATRSHNHDSNAIYAIGYRADMEALRSWGFEAQGTLHRDAEHEILGAVYEQLNDRLTLKVGAGAVVGTGKRSAVVRTGIVWRF